MGCVNGASYCLVGTTITANSSSMHAAFCDKRWGDVNTITRILCTFPTIYTNFFYSNLINATRSRSWQIRPGSTPHRIFSKNPTLQVHCTISHCDCIFTRCFSITFPFWRLHFCLWMDSPKQTRKFDFISNESAYNSCTKFAKNIFKISSTYSVLLGNGTSAQHKRAARFRMPKQFQRNLKNGISKNRKMSLSGKQIAIDGTATTNAHLVIKYIEYILVHSSVHGEWKLNKKNTKQMQWKNNIYFECCFFIAAIPALIVRAKSPCICCGCKQKTSSINKNKHCNGPVHGKLHGKSETTKLSETLAKKRPKKNKHWREKARPNQINNKDAAEPGKNDNAMKKMNGKQRISGKQLKRS